MEISSYTDINTTEYPLVYGSPFLKHHETQVDDIKTIVEKSVTPSSNTALVVGVVINQMMCTKEGQKFRCETPPLPDFLH
ncbi:hypothetical protein KIN20_032681 [Parelaphostrongylus tenuis]|uniref:Uncharacterized protein n=1 Tax=Parelaphostrongylus tenuis TaxID=148309 RepID=A0AAD5R7A6_PARTN|nr:hypothetical protein KIN20_032681 [Parelaphostrongylus tenuis]